MRIQEPLLDRLISATYELGMEQDEVWKEISFIPNTNGRYFISNYGKVISLCRNKPIILQPFLCGDNGSKYYYVSINGKDYRLNRLVAEAFIDNPENKPIVHHKDHNKLNNYYKNLEWATYQENTQAYYKYRRQCEHTIQHTDQKQK